MSSSPEHPFTLHDWASLRAELVWIYDQPVAAGNLDRRDDFRRSFRAWYVRKGTVTVRCDDGTCYRAGSGNWLFLPMSEAHQMLAPGTHLLSVQFHCQWPSGDSLFRRSRGFVIAGKRFPDLEAKASSLATMVHHHFPHAETMYGKQRSDYGIFLKTQALFLDWLSEWFAVQLSLGSHLSHQHPKDDRVTRAVRCLNEAPLDARFPATALRQETELGEAHLNRLFLQSYNLTTRKYWERRKLEYAKACLRSTKMPAKEIAYRLAFKSDSHFVLWFRRHTEKRPGEYRNSEGD